MAKLFVIFVTLLCFGVKTEAQDSFGPLQYKTFNNVQKGANWAKRPEAKLIYGGSEAPGCDVVTLDDDYFLMFATEPGEYNPFDRNYILVPEGEKIYYKKLECILAYCGNKVISFRRAHPKEKIIEKIIEKEKIVEVPKYYAIHDTIIQKIYLEPTYTGGPRNEDNSKRTTVLVFNEVFKNAFNKIGNTNKGNSWGQQQQVQPCCPNSPYCNHREKVIRIPNDGDANSIRIPNDANANPFNNVRRNPNPNDGNANVWRP